MITIPLSLLVCYAFVFGVIIGSFLNVYLYRFHTGKSLSGSSHCLSCQTRLRWYELVPLVSYLALRGRCQTCGAYIPARYFWVELLTGLGFVLVVMTTANPWLWPLYAVLVALLVVTLVYDMRHMIIPHEFVYALGVVALVHITYRWYLVPDWGWIGATFLAGMIAAAPLYAMWKYSDGRWIGLGDAKLALPLGCLVGLTGVFSLLVLSFWIGTTIVLIMMIYQSMRRRGQRHLRFLASPLTMKSEVPFAPFLILSFVAVFFFQVDVLELISYVW